MPALLTENGFIDCLKDLAILRDPMNVIQIARAHISALDKIWSP
ncbi:hypothetical protein DL897_07760 [Thermoflavimicrobium daqui]|jgi:N-acetylmuramoyl-L-alanine amidase|uniref:Uncharacterized protein n=1 Tax=Thermoflavimicrobium daqui TaxID=2137476 RepID=A0A364K6M6_9BACL|nr:hypothetical protein DL897_07760 [Thermoflavimicrobium daqui]